MKNAKWEIRIAKCAMRNGIWEEIRNTKREIRTEKCELRNEEKWEEMRSK